MFPRPARRRRAQGSGCPPLLRVQSRPPLLCLLAPPSCLLLPLAALPCCMCGLLILAGHMQQQISSSECQRLLPPFLPCEVQPGLGTIARLLLPLPPLPPLHLLLSSPSLPLSRPPPLLFLQVHHWLSLLRKQPAPRSVLSQGAAVSFDRWGKQRRGLRFYAGWLPAHGHRTSNIHELCALNRAAARVSDKLLQARKSRRWHWPTLQYVLCVCICVLCVGGRIADKASTSNALRTQGKCDGLTQEPASEPPWQSDWDSRSAEHMWTHYSLLLPHVNPANQSTIFS